MKNFLKGIRFPERIDSGRISKSGLPLKGLNIPNVRSYKAIPKKYDQILLKFGWSNVQQRIRLIVKWDLKSTQNKYLEDRLDYLYRIAKRGDEALFMKASDLLFEKSQTFTLLFINRTLKHWYRDLSIPEMEKIIKETRQINADDTKGLEIKRVMIPKEDGTERPLSVPSKAWRVYANWQYTRM